jgi:hypothetical protein
MTARLVAWLRAVAVLMVASEADAQVDSIRGRITDRESAPVPNATVTITALPNRARQKTRSDMDGMFAIAFPGRSGSYSIEVIAIGFVPRRFELKRTAESSTFPADTRLERSSITLAPVRVGARRRPERSDDGRDDAGPVRAIPLSAVSLSDLGDLAAMAAAATGVLATPGDEGAAGVSVFGLSGDHNKTSLNGLDFAGVELPSNAPVSVGLSTGPYDVSRGGFSGAQLMLRTRRGTNYTSRLLSSTFDAPATHWSDPTATDLGQTYQRQTIGGLVSGPIVYDRTFYAFSFQLGQRSSDLHTLLNADARGLNAAGIAADSVTRLLRILEGLAIPTSTPDALHKQVGHNGSVFGAFDIVAPTRTSGQSFNLTYAGNWSRQTPSYLMPTALPTGGSELTALSGTIQGRHAGYFFTGVLSETSVAINAGRSGMTPFFDLPGGTVLVTSRLPDSTVGIQQLTFGGAPSRYEQSTSQVSARNQLSWYSLNEKHLISITSELRHESGAQLSASNENGSFTFDSLGAVAAAAPSSFSRSLGPRLRRESQWVAAIAMGDRYEPKDALELQYGVRMDVNQFATAPAENPAVNKTFNRRTARLPNHVYLSPRIGFSWIPRWPDSLGANRALMYQRARLSGGVGVFQSLPLVTSIGPALDNTGLATAAHRLTCVGALTPSPQWGTYLQDATAIPTTCAGGAQGVVFANASPNVVLYDPDYRSPRSVRGNLLLSLPLKAVRLFLEGTWSLNLNEPTPMDLNFRDSARFVLAAEGGRPVFVPSASIDPGSGGIDWRASRLSEGFSRVTALRSDSRADARQFSVRLQPSSTGSFDWSLAYVHSTVRDRRPGFGSTGGNPLSIDWARGDLEVRHHLQYSVSVNPLDFARVTWTGSTSSGLPYTPMVAGDVNGDGYANDRAFVFGPTSAADGVAAGMQALLDRSSPKVRDCLSAQLQTVALRNSCRGPRNSTSHLTVEINPVKVRLPRHGVVSMQLSNPLGAFDRWMHGAAGLHGWGAINIPSSTLLYRRGFDAQAQQFRYDVNPQFGAADRTLAIPWSQPRVTLTYAMDVGPAQERQVLKRSLDRGRTDSRAINSAESLRQMLGAQMDLPNPMAEILRAATTLSLTTVQADSIAALNGSYTTFLRSVWNPLWTALGTLPHSYDDTEAYARYRAARGASVDFLIRLAPSVAELLAEEQRRQLPLEARQGLDRDYLRFIRSGTASQGVRGMAR